MNAYLQADTRDRTIGHWSELVAAVPEEEPHHPHRWFGVIHTSGRGSGVSATSEPPASGEGPEPALPVAQACTSPDAISHTNP